MESVLTTKTTPGAISITHEVDHLGIKDLRIPIPLTTIFRGFPRLKKMERLELLRDADLDGRVSTYGVLVLGSLLSIEKSAKKYRVFSRIAPHTHAQFLSLVHSVYTTDTREGLSAYQKRWNSEFSKATEDEQVDILNACAGRGVLAQFPETIVCSLLSRNFERLHPDLLEELAETLSLSALNNQIDSFNLPSLGFFVRQRNQLITRLSTLPLSSPQLLQLNDCVFASAERILHTKINHTSLCRMVACMPDSEIRILFAPATPQSLQLFLQLNRELTQRVVNILKVDCEDTLVYWLSHAPKKSFRHLACILESFSLVAQIHFFLQNPKNLKPLEIQAILRELPEEILIKICQINPDIDLTNESDPSSLLEDLKEVQIVILGMLPSYFPLIERHLRYFSDEDLYAIVFYSQNASLARALLEISSRQDGGCKWPQVAQAASFILSKRDFTSVVIEQLRVEHFKALELLPATSDALHRFQWITSEGLSTAPTAAEIQEVFFAAQNQTRHLQAQMGNVKSVRSLATDCQLSQIAEEVEESLQIRSGHTFKAVLQKTYDFMAEGVERRNQALAAIGSPTLSLDAAPTLLAWMTPAISSDTATVTAMYTSIRASFDEMGITMAKIGDLGFCYEDLFETGLRGNKLQGITNEAQLLSHMTLFQELQSKDLSPQALEEHGTCLQELRELGLTQELLSGMSHLPDILQWKSLTLLQKQLTAKGIAPEILEACSTSVERLALLGIQAETLDILIPETLPSTVLLLEKEALKLRLDANALTETVLARLGYTLEALFESGLRFDNLATCGVSNHRGLEVYMRSRAA